MVCAGEQIHKVSFFSLLSAYAKGHFPIYCFRDYYSHSHGLMVISLPMPLKSLISSPGLDI